MSELKRDIDEATFSEAKAGQDDGVSSYDLCKQLQLSLVTMNNIFQSPTFEKYQKNFMPNKPEKSASIKREPDEVVGPARAGYFKGLIAQKSEENSRLKDTRGMLLEQVSYLRKAVKFLELRKNELEDGIEQMEKNIGVGIEVLEQLEENEDFTKMSAKIAKRNI